ncbi:MAG: hypothetical protein WCJ33_10035, partial [Pseudomonadota bacterium]
MKKLMICASFLSLHLAASQSSDWVMNPKARIFGTLAEQTTEFDSSYFLRSSQGDEIGLNQFGNPVFVDGGLKCEQAGKWFVVHAHFFDRQEAQHQEQL